MGKKKLAVITLSKAVAQFYVQQLNNLFDSRADVVSYNFEDGSLSKFNLPICTLCLQAHPKVTKMRRNGFLKGVRLSYPILLLPSPR